MQTKVELDWPCAKNGTHQALCSSTNLEARREKKTRKSKNNMAQNIRERTGTTGMEKLEYSQGGRQGQGKVARGPYMTESDNSDSYLDILLNTDSIGRLTTSLYDKRDDFDFPIVNFPFLCSNIPLLPAYMVCISPG
jgi:hypothetical protein